MSHNDIFGVYVPGRTAAPIDITPVALPRIRPKQELESYNHSPIKASSEIRLIELLPPKKKILQGPSDEFIKCKIHVHELKEAPAYEALSYTWGNMAANLPVSVVTEGDDEGIGTTPQLMMALRRLRLMSSSRFLWIDQLSIDQSNDSEKGLQVQLMGEIYRKAIQVVIWLGEIFMRPAWQTDVPSDTELMLEMINHVKAQPDTHKRQLNGLVETSQFFDHGRTVESRRTIILYEMLKRQWFQRAWVFQEASLAQKLLVQYGRIELPFDDFKVLAEAMASTQDAAFLRVNLASHTGGFEMIKLIDDTRKRLQTVDKQDTPESVFLPTLIKVLQRVEAFDPHDLIYAFLAFNDLGPGFSITPNYALDVRDVWRNVTETIIKATHSLDIFAAISGDRERELNLPSWVPYWSDCLPYGRPIAAPGRSNFNAARGKEHIFKESENPEYLTVQGTIIDKIGSFESHVIGPVMRGGIHKAGTLERQMIRESLTRTLLHVRQIPWDQVQVRMYTAATDIMRIILLDGANGSKQPLRNTYDLVDASDRHEDVARLRISIPMDEWSDDDKELIENYKTLENLAANAAFKQLFITEQAYLGMAPGTTQIGDLIAIIHGSKAPCILREVGNGMYRILCQCYLDEWMYGKPPLGRPHSKWWEEEPDTFVLI